MPDVTVKTFDELDGHQGQFLFAGKALGITAWGMNVLKLPPEWSDYPEHDHVADGQEEVYLVLEGSARLDAGGKSWKLEPGMLARVGFAQRRKLTPGPRGVTLLALGATPGKAYPLPAWTKNG
jgi:uncharacterized cupin superfamily protein